MLALGGAVPTGPGQPARAGSGAHRYFQVRRINFSLRRFLLPVQQCEFALSSILEQLQRDPWVVKPERRPQRSTGVAMSVAVSLLEVHGCNATVNANFAGNFPQHRWSYHVILGRSLYRGTW